MENNRQKEIEAHKLTDDNNPALYVGTYGKYNNASLEGAWIDLTTFADEYEFLDFCENVLHADENDPELMFQDFMNFPEAYYSESASAKDLAPIWEWIELDEEEREYVQEYWDEIDSRAEIDTIKDRLIYHGDFDDFAVEMADECMMIPENIKPYFDYEAFARDLKLDYYVTENYVFTTN